MTRRNPNITYNKNCLNCGKKLEGRQRRWCGHVCEVINWQKKNKQKTVQYQKSYLLNHPIRRKRSVKKYDISEKGRIRRKEWERKNADRLREQARINSKRYRDRLTAQRHKRRAIIKGLDKHYTAQEWRELKEKFGNKCLACGKKEPEVLITPDHIIPIIKKGKNTIDNIQPLCRTCNFRKNKHHSIDYRKLVE